MENSRYIGGNAVSHLLACFILYQKGDTHVARDHFEKSIYCFEILRTPLELAIAHAVLADTLETSQATSAIKQSISEF